MNKPEHLKKPPIEPLYRQSSANAAIDFGLIEVTISDSDDAPARKVKVHPRQRFVPREAFEFSVPAPDGQDVIASITAARSRIRPDTKRLQLCDQGTSIDVFCTFSSHEHSVYKPRRTPVQIRPESNSISRVTFHLLNWPDFWGPDNYVLRTGEPPLEGAKSCGQVLLDVDGWKITVAATEYTDSAVKGLAESGGYFITHVGSIERKDRTVFSTSSLDELLACLSYFFSFALGRWTTPSLVVGFDDCDDRVYEQWGIGRTADGSWNGANSWFDAHHSEFLAELLPGFRSLWSNEIWHRPLSEAIYWYTSANRIGSGIGVDSALLFTQAALELLSWTYCVLDRKMVSPNAFKQRGLSAADKLRLLASSLNIPLEIPQCLAALHAKPGKKWDDSMEAITDLRNGLVHPGKDKSVPEDAYYDAWRLSQWYIDLILLRLCLYSGKYANRLSQRWVGQVEPVPWSS